MSSYITYINGVNSMKLHNKIINNFKQSNNRDKFENELKQACQYTLFELEF